MTSTTDITFEFGRTLWLITAVVTSLSPSNPKLGTIHLRPVTFDDRYPRTVDETKRKPTRWPLTLIGALFVVATMGVVAWNVELPYLAYSAGPVSDAADLVVAEGVEFYPSDGELLMLTVVSQDVNIFEVIIAGVDPTIDLIRKQAVRREGESDEEYRNRSLQQMDDSNFRSISVALGYLEIEMITTDIVINEIVGGVPANSVLQLGDSIKAINGLPVKEFADLALLVEDAAIGDVLLMTVIRGEEMLDVDVVLVEREDEPGVAMIGVTLGVLTDSPVPTSDRVWRRRRPVRRNDAHTRDHRQSHTGRANQWVGDSRHGHYSDRWHRGPYWWYPSEGCRRRGRWSHTHPCAGSELRVGSHGGVHFC